MSPSGLIHDLVKTFLFFVFVLNYTFMYKKESVFCLIMFTVVETRALIQVINVKQLL